MQTPDNICEGLEREAKLEIACRLYKLGKLSLFFAARMAGVSQAEFEDILLERQIPIYQYDLEDLENDLRTLRAGKD